MSEAIYCVILIILGYLSYRTFGEAFSVGGASSGSNKWKQCTTTNDCITHYKKRPHRNAVQAAHMNNPCKRKTASWTFFNAKEQTNRMCMGGYCNCDSGWTDDDTSPRPPPPAPTTTPKSSICKIKPDLYMNAVEILYDCT